MNHKPEKAFQRVIRAIDSKNYEAAELVIKELIQIDKNNVDKSLELAIEYAKENKLIEASKILCCLLKHRKNDIRVAYNLGITYSFLGNHRSAIAAYDLVLENEPNDVETLINKGSTYNDIKNYALALDILNKAIQIKPDIPEAWSNRGIALNNLNLYEEAISSYTEAIRLNPNYPEAWSNKSIPLNELRLYADALNACDRAINIRPNYAQAWYNKGNIFYTIQRFDEAVTSFNRAIYIKPDYHEAWSNKGTALFLLKRFDEAVFCFDQSLSLKPNYAEALANKGAIFNELKRYEEAIANYDKALNLKSDIDWIYGDLLNVRMKICNWLGIENALEALSKKIVQCEAIANPFILLALIDDLLLQKKSSDIYVKKKYPINLVLGPINKYKSKEKIRIGYFSADFRNHAVSILAAELFELHDKSKFEIFALSYGIDDESPIRSRLTKAFTQFIDVRTKSDQEIAALARSIEIDIAIDLGGHADGGRTGIFACRAAPIQLSYIGYLGTMGAEYYDYLLADKVIIPNGSDHFYTEKIAYLPSYQVNDRKRSISNRQFTRRELGLPENSFVFCCFNSNFKILPATFDSWMRILEAVENSVLFLCADNEWSKTNLINEARLRGIDSSKLIFGERIPNEEYLARYRSCDLFLDTFPYNAGTTASDALWTGLPVLTLMGQSFASRVAASLLNAIGLPELITNSREEYEKLAIELAKSPKKLASIKQKLLNNRLTTPLFDTPLFTKNLETVFKKMYERHQEGLEPDHITIA